MPVPLYFKWEKRRRSSATRSGQLLDLSRLEQAQVTLSWGRHDLLALLTSVMEALSLTAPRHQLHLVLHGRQAGQGLAGWFDWERMQQSGSREGIAAPQPPQNGS